jgi:hypothetical protein
MDTFIDDAINKLIQKIIELFNEEDALPLANYSPFILYEAMKLLWIDRVEVRIGVYKSSNYYHTYPRIWVTTYYPSVGQQIPTLINYDILKYLKDNYNPTHNITYTYIETSIIDNPLTFLYGDYEKTIPIDSTSITLPEDLQDKLYSIRSKLKQFLKESSACQIQ